jgi:hypothetical protein
VSTGITRTDSSLSVVRRRRRRRRRRHRILNEVVVFVIVQSLSSSFLRYGATRYHHRAIYLIRSGVVATPRSCARLPEMQQEGKVESAGDNTCGVMGVLRGDHHFYLVFSASSSGAGTTGDNTSASWAWLRGDQHLSHRLLSASPGWDDGDNTCGVMGGARLG